MTLFEALLWCEKVNKLYNQRNRNNRSKRSTTKKVRKPLTDKQIAYIEQLKKNYRKTALRDIPLRRRSANDVKEDDFIDDEGGREKLTRGPLKSRYKKAIVKFKYILPHLKTSNDTEEKNRLEDAKFLINTLEYPQEVWEQPYSKRLIFIKQFKTIKNGKWITLNLTAVVRPDRQLLTYYHTIDNPSASYVDRWGKCVYTDNDLI